MAKTLYPVWAKLNTEQHYLATQIALSELLLSGCTFAADHHYLFPQQLSDAIDVQVEASKQLGIRVMLTRGSMSLGEDSGGLPPQHTVQDMDTILLDSERLVQKYHQRSADAMVNIALAPCSPFSVTQRLCEKVLHWQKNWMYVCIPIWPKHWMKNNFACQIWHAYRRLSGKCRLAQVLELGWRMAFILMPMRSTLRTGSGRYLSLSTFQYAFGFRGFVQPSIY